MLQKNKGQGSAQFTLSPAGNVTDRQGIAPPDQTEKSGKIEEEISEINRDGKRKASVFCLTSIQF
jgi:hypothetical protein